MKYSENPDEFDFRTVKAKLAQLLHHFDEVDTVIRVMEYTDDDKGFLLSMTPPPDEDEIEVVVQKLEEEGYEYRVEDDLFVFVTGE